MIDNHEEKPLFTDQLKEAGRELHSAVENTSLVQSMFKGEISDEAYQDYLASLFAIYFQLENEVRLNSISVDESISPIFQPLVVPELFRAQSIKQDLKAFGNTDLALPETAEAYKNHLIALSTEKPHCLVAHYYLRFLGDLFGGQILAGRLSARFDGKLAFYDFTELCQKKDLSKPVQFVSKFRQIYNNLPLDQQQLKDVLAEVSEGYRLHLQLFRELEARHMSNG